MVEETQELQGDEQILPPTEQDSMEEAHNKAQLTKVKI